MPRRTNRRPARYRNAPINKPKDSTKVLQRKLVAYILGILILTILIISSTGSLAPKIGALFGILSKNRNTSEERISVAPNPPILSDIPNATKEKEMTVTGFAQPGMSVKIYINGPEKGETTVGADGLFTFSDLKLNSGRNTIFAKATDTYNVESDKSKTYIVNVDTDDPEIEITSPNNGETIKNLDKRINIEGKVNEKATVTINDRVAIVRPDLTFEFLLGVDEGNVKITVKAVDEAGNEKEEVINVTYKKES